MIEIPIAPAESPEANWGLHIDTHLTPPQSNVLRRMTQRLDQERATLVSGKRVTSATDAVKYLLELAAAAAVE